MTPPLASGCRRRDMGDRIVALRKKQSRFLHRRAIRALIDTGYFVFPSAFGDSTASGGMPTPALSNAKNNKTGIQANSWIFLRLWRRSGAPNQNGLKLMHNSNLYFIMEYNTLADNRIYCPHENTCIVSHQPAFAVARIGPRTFP